jgi:hypothetical protein
MDITVDAKQRLKAFNKVGKAEFPVEDGFKDRETKGAAESTTAKALMSNYRM